MDVKVTTKINKSRLTGIRVPHKDIERYGATPGCPACKYTVEGRKVASGVAHSKDCTKRIEENLEAQG